MFSTCVAFANVDTGAFPDSTLPGISASGTKDFPKSADGRCTFNMRLSSLPNYRVQVLPLSAIKSKAAWKCNSIPSVKF